MRGCCGYISMTCDTTTPRCFIAQGADAKYISETMGHSSIRMTFDVYGHLFARTRKQASACLEAALLSSPLASATVTTEEYRPLPVHP